MQASAPSTGVTGSYCFDPSAFYDDAFDVSSWVQQLLGPEPREDFVETLQDDLVRLEAAMKAQVVAVVNKDYAGFVQVTIVPSTCIDLYSPQM